MPGQLRRCACPTPPPACCAPTCLPQPRPPPRHAPPTKEMRPATSRRAAEARAAGRQAGRDATSACEAWRSGGRNGYAALTDTAVGVEAAGGSHSCSAFLHVRTSPSHCRFDSFLVLSGVTGCLRLRLTCFDRGTAAAYRPYSGVALPMSICFWRCASCRDSEDSDAERASAGLPEEAGPAPVSAAGASARGEAGGAGAAPSLRLDDVDGAALASTCPSRRIFLSAPARFLTAELSASMEDAVSAGAIASASASSASSASSSMSRALRLCAAAPRTAVVEAPCEAGAGIAPRSTCQWART